MTGVATSAGEGVRRYRIEHRTEYTYAGDVTGSYGWAYLTPRDLPDQACLSSRVDVTPPASMITRAVDYFGNRASYFEVHEPHERLVVTASSLVEVNRATADLSGLERWSWEEAAGLVRAEAAGDPDSFGFLLPSPRLPHSGLLLDYADRLLPAGRPLGQTLRDLIHRIYHDFRYRSGSTTVSTTLDEVITKGEGVCQDFAHLAVAVLRHAGLPARYVSGYLETQPPAGKPKLLGVDASHAWVSVLVPELGWVDLDPTNDKVVNGSYVVTAWGRDYTDVPPLKGVIFTESKSSTIKVAVDVLRV